MTVRFLEVLQRNGYDLQLSLKAEGLGINFSNVATRSDVSPLRFSTMSDVWWFDSILLSLGCFPTGISDGQQNQRVYNQRVNCMHQCSILNLLDIPS